MFGTNMSLETAELEQLITPIDKMVVRYLKQNKNGVTIMDIVHRIQSEVGEDHGNLGQAVTGVLANAIELGFIEKKSSKTDETCHCESEQPRRRWRRGRGRSRSSRRRSRSRSRGRRRRRCIRRRRLRPRCI
ncbi:hypothetical protein MSG28_008166 [Choristoneura fumiferana]|uniref:Uncharacterized protein n=1 Tax=Choristoneura fumiferana TaxID=7141 RepID=A0ACC0JA93_CHOFU|nr:hypothetical protein MSG28_008166 [Choristoneura fumiferana]